MIGTSEANLHKYLQGYLPKAQISPFRQAVVVATKVDEAPVTAFVQHIGEPQADPTAHTVLGTGYLPAPGDKVLMVQVDDKKSVILGPVGIENNTKVLSPIQVDRQVVGDDSTPTSFTIPQTGFFPRGYSALRSVFCLQTTSGNNTDWLYGRFNQDSGAHYDYDIWYDEGSANVLKSITLGATQANLGACQGGTGGAYQFSWHWLEIIGYDQTLCEPGYFAEAAYHGGGWLARHHVAGRWSLAQAAADAENITSMLIWPSAGGWAKGSFITTWAIP